MASAEVLNPALFQLHRVFYLAIGIFAVLMALIGVLSLFGPPSDDAGLGLVGIGLLPLALLHWYAATGARLGKSYGRTISRVIACFWLLGVPIGTYLGIQVFRLTGNSRWQGARTA